MLLLALLLALLAVPPDPAPPDTAAAAPTDVSTFATYSDSLAAFYGMRDVDGMQRLLRQASTLEQQLLARYRLFPVTRDHTYLANLPDEDAPRTARAFALLSALWAYRVADAPPWKMPAYGKRSEALLDRAKDLDPDDPYVLLVEGQALLYKPALFGGDLDAALTRFTQLRRVLMREARVGIAPVEAEVWAWYAMHKLGHEAAEPLRARLLAAQPPVLFRQFLTDPP